MYELGQQFHIPDLSRHLYVIGRSGAGKTVLLENLVRQLRDGFVLLDPHGDSAQRCLDFLDPNETIYFDAGDLSHSIGWNPLQNIPPDDHYLVASQVVLSLKAIWGDSWGPRMEYILLASVMLLLARQGYLVQLPRLLSESNFRDEITRKLSLDPFLREVWVTEFANKDRRWWEEAISPIQNKIGIIMLSPHLRQVLGQTSTIDLRRIMDTGKVLVCNLAKGRLGMASNLLGSLLVSAFYRAAESRADTPEELRRPFTLVADEFQNFATDSFEEILSESRKWKLQLLCSHQTLSQISPQLQDALLANIGTLIAFRVGGKDARRLADEFVFTRPLSPSDEVNIDGWSALVGTPRFHAWIRDHDYVRVPRLVSTVPPSPSLGRAESVKRHSRACYERPRSEVEARLRKLLA
jgi:type IV secretory pathway TraG/TraD family ATPase VirD4